MRCVWNKERKQPQQNNRSLLGADYRNGFGKKRLFYGTSNAYGTIALLTNLAADKTPEQVYISYKSRADIEILFDTFKDILDS